MSAQGQCELHVYLSGPGLQRQQLLKDMYVLVSSSVICFIPLVNDRPLMLACNGSTLVCWQVL